MNSLAHEARNDLQHWMHNDRVCCVTNNLIGFQFLSFPPDGNVGNSLNDSRNRPRLRCSMLPGKVRSRIGAGIDRSTVDALWRTRQSNQSAFIIGVTSGRYVMCDGAFREVIPLVDDELERRFKTALYDSADQVFVLSRLGDVVQNVVSSRSEGSQRPMFLDSFNADMAEGRHVKPLRMIMPDESRYRDENRYSELKRTWQEKSVLVTTYRDYERHLLGPHFAKIRHSFSEFDESALGIEKGRNGPFLLSCDWPRLPSDGKAQKEYETPELTLRTMYKYFYMSPQILKEMEQ